MTDSTLLDVMRSALAVLEGAPTAGWGAAADGELRELVSVTARVRHAVERHSALGAGEVARRSTPDRGLSGFVQKAGHRTVEEFLKAETGVTGRDAATAVRVGSLDGALGDALRDGRVSVPAAEAIRAGLGTPTVEIPRELLDQAAAKLCTEPLDPDRLQRRAREVRDELDEAGIVDREHARRAQRSLRLVRQPDGVWLLDPESAAIVTTVYDRATSPRRGGPRFADPTAREKAARIADDDRTIEQLASDTFTELLRQSASIDTEVLVGGNEQAWKALCFTNVLKAPNILRDVVCLAAADVVVGDEDTGDGTLFDERLHFIEAFESNDDAPSETFKTGWVGGENFGARENLEWALRRQRRAKRHGSL